MGERNTIEVLTISAIADGFRVGGLVFNKAPTHVPVSLLSPFVREQISADARADLLTVKEQTVEIAVLPEGTKEDKPGSAGAFAASREKTQNRGR